MNNVRQLAGTKLINFMQSGLAEELAEGVVPAVLIGGAQLFDENVPTEQALTNTALMAAMGTGVGMGARGAGAYIGKKIYDKPIKNPHVNQIFGSLGQQGVFQGMQQGIAQNVHQMRKMQRGMAEDRVKMMAQLSPEDLAKVLKVSPDKIDDLLPLVKRLDEHLESEVKGIDSLAEKVGEAAEKMKGHKNDAVAHMGNAADAFSQAVKHGPQDVTGEHIGRGIGRVAGDEIGIAAGLGIGTMIGDQMGWMSPQQLEIKKLEKKIKELGGQA